MYDTPDQAAVSVPGGATDGWRFWLADTPKGPQPLATLGLTDEN